MMDTNQTHTAPSDQATPEQSFGADEKFWKGFGLPGCPRFDGLSVLEVGSGGGRRCLEVRAHGARRVLGVDPYEEAVAEANQALAQMAPASWHQSVSFTHGTIASTGDERFDTIISENTLEHVMDVPGLLREVRNHLKPRGKAYIGFGPPYEAPDGDHGWLRAMLPGHRWLSWPWGHLLLRRYAFRRLSAQHGRTLTETHDWPYLNLNELTIAEYHRMFRESGLRIASLQTNSVYSLKGKLVRAAAKLPGLARYLTLNMFVILEHE